MSDPIADVEFESGQMGRIAAIRLKPNTDLVCGIEEAVREAGFSCAFVRAGVGSLTDAALGYGAGEEGSVTTLEGPGIEILTINGEVRILEDGQAFSMLQGTVSDTDANVYGGIFLPGGNPVCLSVELMVQEWVSDLS